MKQLLLFLICNLAFLLTVQGNSAEIPPAVMFKQLSTTEGLSNNSVRSIYRDNRGFLWVGTESGLNKYDGYSFQQYYQNNSDLPDDAISEIFEGPDDNVWIRTSSGYSIYNYKTGKFDNDYKPILDGLQIPSKNILRMGKTSKNEFWAYDYSKLYIRSMDNSSIKAYPLAVEKISNLYIGVQFIYIMYSNGTLYSISKQTSEVKEIAIPTIYRPLLENHEPHIYIDQNESLWVYTFQNSLLLHKNSFTQQWEDISLNNNTHIQYNRVQRILDLGDGNVWILTSHMGLFVYNTLTKSLTNLVHNPLKPHTIASNNLNTIYRDKDGTIYIGNFKHGISYYSPMSQIILCNKSLEYDDILTFCEDTSQEYIYYGTDGTGLIRRSLVTDSYEKIATPANIVVDLSIDSKNRLWIGTFQKGLLCYSKGQIKQYTVSNSQLLENNVYTVKVDKHGYIWIGTMKGYIQRLNPETGQFDTILYRPGEFFVRDMYYDKDSTLYVATKGGLIIIDTETQAYNIYAEAGRFKENNMLTVYKAGKNQSNNGGSGIGLHIVSEYVKMHQGTVCVRDNQPCGSVFLIALPLHQNSNETKNGEPVEGPEIKEESHPFTILLVDDNYDFLKFLSESLARQYHVLKATNGKHALNVLEKEDIDLVVSDIMMPEMDGLELCSTIKNDIRYSHIPIILLTAKASEEHQLEGLSVGADDYITKPFNMEVLKLRINKIIEMNVKRQEIFNQDIKIEPSRITITPLDQQLVEKAIQIVEDNISETEFSVEELASSLNISRSYFYKKMIKITGKKPIEFIRTIRMKRAQQLLTESQMQVSEIAYTLGYNSPKIFSKHFKEEFNISPSEFIRQQAE